MDKLTHSDIRAWPETANLTQWQKLLRLSYVTMLKYRRLGKLDGTKDLSGRLTISKATVLKAFGITPSAKQQSANASVRRSR